MTNTGAIRAGRAFVELFADSSKLVAGLKAASAKLKAFGSAINRAGLKLFGLGAAAMAPLLGAAKVYADVGRNLDTLSQRTGISVEALSALQYAANRVDVDFESLTGGIARMQRKLGDAATGEKAAAEALGKLGLEAKDLLGLPVEKQFQAIADRIAAMQDPTLRAAAAMEVFGRGGAALLPILNQGSAGIQDLMQRAKDLGLVISSDDAKAANEFALVLKDLWATVKRGVFAVGSALSPILKGAAEWIQTVAVRVTEWTNTHKEVIQKVLITIAVVMALGVALIALGKAIVLVAAVLKGVALMIAVVKAAFFALGAVIGALTTPLGIVIAVVAALAAYWFYASGEMAKTADWLGQKFGELKTEVLAAYQGIADALAAGDVALAARILWSFLKLEWKKGIGWLLEQWSIFKAAFLEIALKAWYGALAGLTIAWGALERGWFHTVAFLQKVWFNFIGAIRSAWAISQNWLAKRMVELQGIFDSSIDVDAVKKSLDETLSTELAGIGLELEKREGEITKRRDERLKESREQQEGTLAEIGKGYEAAEQARKDKLASEITALGADVKRARKEFDALRKGAREERQKKEAGAPGAPKRPPTVEGIRAGFDEAKKRTIAVAGAFEAGAAARLGFVGGVADRLAKSSEETAKNTKKIADAIDSGGLTFP